MTIRTNSFKVGDKAIIEAKEVHSWHTKLYLVGIPGKFNSVSFTKFNEPSPEDIAWAKREISEIEGEKAVSNGIAMEDHPGLKE
jgi:hypothetical protein